MSSKESPGKLPLKTVVGYGIGGIGENVAYNLFYMFFIFFLTTVAGISPGAAGAVSMLAVGWDAVSDPIVGYISDRFKSKGKTGKRATFILGGAIPLGISIFLLFCDINIGQTAKLIYFIAINIIFWLFFTIVDIPYIAVANEVTDDYDTKTNMRTSCLLFSSLGQMILAVGIMKYLDYTAAIGQADALTWRIIGAVLGFVATTTFILAALALRGKERKTSAAAGAEAAPKEKQDLRSVAREVANMFKLRQFLLTSGMAFLYNMHLGIVSSAYLFYLMYTLNFSNNEIALLNLWPGLVYLIFVIPMGKILNKVGKRIGMLASFTYLIIYESILLFATPSLPVMVVFEVGLFLESAMFWIVIYSMNFDIGEIYEFKYGRRADGLMISISSFLTKLGVAVGMWVTGFIMQLMNVDPSAETVTENMGFAMRIVRGAIPAGICLLMIILCLMYRVKKEHVLSIQEAIRLRKEGKEYSTESFEKVL